MNTNKNTGTVKFFNTDKCPGYGFITDDRGGDVFVHIKEVEKAGLSNLTTGQKVSYDIEDRRGKEAAANITIV